MARTTKSQSDEAGGAKAASKPATTKTATTKAPAKKTAAQADSKTDGKAAKADSSKADAGKAEKPAFDKKFLDEQRKLLLEERSRYVKSAESLKAEADALVEGREPGDVQFDEESGEGDTLAVERERDLALSAHARAAVEEIDAALARLDAGTYGICVISGKPIPKERLKAIPWASERVEYKAGGFGIVR